MQVGFDNKALNACSFLVLYPPLQREQPFGYFSMETVNTHSCGGHISYQMSVFSQISIRMQSYLANLGNLFYVNIFQDQEFWF